jgi:outer membrane lipoprotein-sorting protein
MNNLLERLDRVVPDAPEFVGSVMNRLPELAPTSTASGRRKWTRMLLGIGVMAASLLIGGSMFVIFVLSPSPQAAFGQMVQRVAQYDSVRYDFHYNDGGANAVDHRTLSSGDRRRSEFDWGPHQSLIIIHNGRTSPDLDLRLESKFKSAEFDLVDSYREANLAKLYPNNPVEYLEQVAAKDVVPAPDEIYQGKPVRVFVSKPGNSDERRTTRVLADKETGMPIRIETQANQIMDNFEWNPPLDDSTYNTVPPAGYNVTYYLIKPLSQGLDNYAAFFHGRFPDHIDAAAMDQLRREVKSLPNPGKEDLEMTIADAKWGFGVPAFAAAHGIDLRYYGAGLSQSQNQPRKMIVAVETAPGSGNYDCQMSDFSRARVHRSQLPN